MCSVVVPSGAATPPTAILDGLHCNTDSAEMLSDSADLQSDSADLQSVPTKSIKI